MGRFLEKCRTGRTNVGTINETFRNIIKQEHKTSVTHVGQRYDNCGTKVGTR